MRKGIKIFAFLLLVITYGCNTNNSFDADELSVTKISDVYGQKTIRVSVKKGVHLDIGDTETYDQNDTMYVQVSKNKDRYVYRPIIALKLNSGINYVNLQGTKIVCLDTVK